MTASTYFQSTGRPKNAMIIGLTRQVIFLIPAFTIMPRIWGLNGVWYAGPTADIISVVISAIVMIPEISRLTLEKR